MKKVTTKIHCNDGSIERRPKDMKQLLNYNILSLLNRAERTGPLEMPVLYSDTEIYPDFLALYSQTSLYNLTSKTAVCFYQFDKEFDGKKGLFWAIYYNDKERLDYFKERFRNVKIIITPDYSVFGDIPPMENLYRIWKARIVALWFSLELHTVVIPNISYVSEKTFPLYFSGLENCRVIAFSTKGHMRDSSERQLLETAIMYAVDNLPLKAIVIYSVCRDDESCHELFKYAEDNNIKIIIPENTLRSRNRLRRCG